ncbi:unnamed protein product [Mycena citricolor]|uniref:Uncharacterized protein n=1 Tax=Mycena citricolor TaxID=2018698 RepID=A0AAD2JYV8_9AGAR|nr:unnamed protein product [Mycena citricolor]
MRHPCSQLRASQSSVTANTRHGHVWCYPFPGIRRNKHGGRPQSDEPADVAGECGRTRIRLGNSGGVRRQREPSQTSGTSHTEIVISIPEILGGPASRETSRVRRQCLCMSCRDTSGT